MPEPLMPPEAKAEPESDLPSRRLNILKGCGCVTGLGVLALGILIIGHFDSGAWASALTAIVIGVLVFALSGTNGFWES